MCRWRGFTAEIDSPLEESIILEDCPQVLLNYITNVNTDMSPELTALADKFFPTRTKQDLQELQPDTTLDTLLRNTPHRLNLDDQAPEMWSSQTTDDATEADTHETPTPPRSSASESRNEGSESDTTESETETETPEKAHPPTPVISLARDAPGGGMTPTTRRESGQRAENLSADVSTPKHDVGKDIKRAPGYVCETEPRSSTIPGAGMGLFMLEEARAGDRVARYTGDDLTADEAAASESAYLFRVNKNLFLDAQDPQHENGRYINDGAIAGREVNAKFGAARYAAVCKKTGRRYISVRATKTIPAGAEVLASYGRGYWGKNGFDREGNLHQVSTDEKRAPEAGVIVATDPRTVDSVSNPPVRRLGPVRRVWRNPTTGAVVSERPTRRGRGRGRPARASLSSRRTKNATTANSQEEEQRLPTNDG